MPAGVMVRGFRNCRLLGGQGRLGQGSEGGESPFLSSSLQPEVPGRGKLKRREGSGSDSASQAWWRESERGAPGLE